MARVTMLKDRVATLDTSIARPPAKVADPHYQSPEHRDWSRKVIERARGQCQGRKCGRTGVRLFADHIVEIRDGGDPLDLANGQALCGSCHTAKTNAVRAQRMRS